MSGTSPSDKLVGYITASQDRLRAYILACLGSYNNAMDVLQGTNVVLLRKGQELDDQRLNLDEFQTWAIQVARYEILAYVRDSKRRGLVFAPELAELMCQVAESKLHHLSARQSALRHCLSTVSEDRQELVRLRYSQDLTTRQIASEVGRSESSVKVMLHRLRRALHKCIELRLQERGAAGTPA